MPSAAGTFFMVKLKASMQTFEKRGANFTYFTQVGANLKKILMFGPKLGV